MNLATLKGENKEKFDWLRERRDVLDPKKNIAGRPKTPKQLHAYIDKDLQLDIPQKSICPGHAPPFSYVSDSFFEIVRNCIVIACRNGGKTNDSAALEFSESKWKDSCETAHLGAILAQSNTCYKYIRKWAYKYPDIISRTIQKETAFQNGSSISIIAGTMNGVNSPHPHKAVIDEFELLPWEIFEEAASMPKSGDGILSALRLVTTRKKSYGNAQLMITEADQRGFKLYTWCIFEVMAPCDHPKSCRSCPYKSHISFDNNGDKHTWPSVCQGKAKKCSGYYAFQDVLEKFRTLSWEKFDAQWLCNRPERFDCVFPEFNFDRNSIPSWDIKKHKKEDGWRLGRGWDFGLDDPTVCLYYQYNLDLKKCVQFDELILSGHLIEDIGDRVRKYSDKIEPDPEEWEDWGDPSGSAITGVDGRSYIGKLREKEISVQKQRQKVGTGIQALKKMLRVNNFTGKPMLYSVRGKCSKSIQAFEMAGWDRIETDNKKMSREKYKHDEHSHSLDAGRYFVSGVFPFDENVLGLG